MSKRNNGNLQHLCNAAINNTYLIHGDDEDKLMFVQYFIYVKYSGLLNVIITIIIVAFHVLAELFQISCCCLGRSCHIQERRITRKLLSNFVIRSRS